MNLTHYCLMDGDQIAAGPCSLPDRWRGHQGLKYMDDATLAALGWVPVIDTEDDAPAHGDAVLIVESDRVRRHRPAASPTPEALIAQIVSATQQRLDAFAQTRNYDGIMSAATYATSTVHKFRAEGQYCVEARDATWATLYQILAEVEAGTRPAPTGFADVEPELPVLAWPT